MFVLPGAEITENKVNLSSICVDDSSLNLNSNLPLTLGNRANGRNIVGQKPPTLLDVTCWVRLHTMLHVVGSCRVVWNRSNLWTSNSQHIFWSVINEAWCHARALHMVSFQNCFIHKSSSRVYKVVWVVSFPRCTVGNNIVGSCCTRLHLTANTDATTPNIAGRAMLKVVASVCT